MQIDLKGCFIIEKDINNQNLWTWSYPSITDDLKTVITRNCRELEVQNQVFAFFKFKNVWCYINMVQIFETDSLPQVKQLWLVVTSTNYHPEKYGMLCRIFSKRYCKTGNPVVVLKLFLSVTIQGTCTTDENGTFTIKDYENNLYPTNGNHQLSELISVFGLETILIYTAILLNKRVFVYDHNLASLLQAIETLPLLLLHRDLSQSLFPWIHQSDDELDDLKSHQGFIAGCTNSNIVKQTELFDIFVNLPAHEIFISPQAKETFTMTKTHKEIALFLVQLSETPGANIVDELNKKTTDLIGQLRLLADVTGGNKQKFVEVLRTKNFPPPLETFLFSLAVAENLILL